MKDYAEYLEDMMPQNRPELNVDEDGRPVEGFQDRYEEDEEGV